MVFTIHHLHKYPFTVTKEPPFTIHTTIEPPLKLWKTIYMIVMSSLYSGICYSPFTQLPCIISHIPLSHHWITIYLIMFMVYHSHNYHLPL